MANLMTDSNLAAAVAKLLGMTLGGYGEYLTPKGHEWQYGLAPFTLVGPNADDGEIFDPVEDANHHFEAIRVLGIMKDDHFVNDMEEDAYIAVGGHFPHHAHVTSASRRKFWEAVVKRMGVKV